MDEDRDRGLPKGSVVPRPETAAEQVAPVPKFDLAGTSRIIVATNKRRRKPLEKGQKPKKRARSVVQTPRDEVEPDLIIRRVGVAPSVESVPEEEATVPPFPSVGEGPSAPALHTGDVSSEETPLQRTRRSGLDSTAEAEQGAEPISDTEALVDTGSLPAGDPAATSEAPDPTEAAGAAPASPTPAPMSDNFDDMFSDTPPATREASGSGNGEFQHLLQVKADQLSRAAALSTLQSELEAAKAKKFRLRDELAEMVEKNRLLEADKVGLSQDNARFSSRLGELEATISQLRRELDSIRTDAVSMAKRHRLGESENAEYKDKMRVFQEKVEDRARICDELKTKLEETAEANDLLKAELEWATQVQRILDVEREKLVGKLAQAEAGLAEALKNVEYNLSGDLIKWFAHGT
ncbi:uncharacterized protein LOC132631271 [Lycium barbarum]|uniref:uncharacterized protein LOC132631271 n=1 Tax=Lycium barbarum TaxID=112863 RepID=UPI00293F4F6D|nr:uncharacterized protein LOC132631271 [Lycium barbarum]